MDPKLETTSNEIVQASAPVQQPAVEKPKKSGGLIATATIMTILALAGIAFGVYGMFFFPKPTCESETPNTNTSETTTENETTTAPSVAEVQQLLETKYGYAEVIGTWRDGITSTLWDHMDDFNETIKIAYTIEASDESITEKDYSNPIVLGYIDYEVLNNKYKSLFGNANDLPKEAMEIKAHAIEKITYLPDTNSFEIQYANGLGGVPRFYNLSKVIEVNGSAEKFTAILSTTTVDSFVESSVMNTDPDTGKYIITMSPEYLAETARSIKANKLNFIQEDGAYKLISIE